MANRRPTQLLSVSALLLAMAACVAGNAVIPRVALIGETGIYINGEPQLFPLLAVQGCQQALEEVYGAGAGVNCIYNNLNAAATYANMQPFVINASYSHFVGIGFQVAILLPDLARDYPNCTFTLVDASGPEGLRNLQGLSFNEAQSGFLAGVAAGLFALPAARHIDTFRESVTDTNKVGVISAIPFLPLVRFRNGFLMGVLYVCPECTVYGTYIPSFTDEAVSVPEAQGMIDRGIDVLFAAAALSGSRAIYYAAGKGILVIGVDGDESKTTFANMTDPRREYYLTSAEKRVDVAVYKSIKERFAAVYQPGNKVLDASYGGVRLSPCNSTAVCALMQKRKAFYSETAAGDQCPVVRSVTVGERIDQITNLLKGGLVATGVQFDGQLLNLLPAANVWSKVTPFGDRPPVLRGHSMVVDASNNIFLYGGETKTGAASAALYMLDFDEAEWWRLPNGPAALADHAAAIRGDTFFVFGGRDQGVFSNAVYAFNKTSLTWSTVSASGGPSARAEMAAVQVGSTMYLFGGYTGALQLTSEFWSFNLVTRTWSALSSSSAIPAMRGAAFAANAATGTLYLFGGYSVTGVTDRLYQYSIAANAWTDITGSFGGQRPRPLSGARAWMADPYRLMIAGGVGVAQGGGDALSSSVYVLNFARGQWVARDAADMPDAVQAFSVVAFNQTQDPKACVYTKHPFAQPVWCTVSNRLTVVAYGGFGTRGLSNQLLLFRVGDPSPIYTNGTGALYVSGGGIEPFVIPVAVIIPTSVAIAAGIAIFVRQRSQRRNAEKRAMNWLIRASEIEFKEKIGEGSFGEVFMGRFRGTVVALKTIKNTGDNALDDRLKSLRTDNINGTVYSAMMRGAGAGSGSAGSGSGFGSRIIRKVASRLSSRLSNENGGTGRSARSKSGIIDPLAVFVREVDTYAGLRHPNIVQFMGACLDIQSRCLVMEYMAGGSLMDFYKSHQPFTWLQRIACLRDAALGMVYLHSANPPILHRDMKSLNLLLDDRGRVKVGQPVVELQPDMRLCEHHPVTLKADPSGLCCLLFNAGPIQQVSDFGLAMLKPPATGKGKQEQAHVAGSFMWLAPELFSNSDKGLAVFDEKCDVYSYGIVIYEVAGRYPPYEEVRAMDHNALMMKVVIEHFRPVMPIATPEPVATLAKLCTSPDKVLRPAFTDIVDTLEALGKDPAVVRAPETRAQPVDIEPRLSLVQARGAQWQSA